MKRRITVSFSGGRSSAVMTKRTWEELSDHCDVENVFVNTGCEHEKTLEFIDHFQRDFGIPVTWIEPVFAPRLGDGVRAKEVTFATASRNGEPFHAMIAKHGIPGPGYPFCTSKLKEEPMNSFRRRTLGWKRGTYETAIGIRADEIDRMSDNAERERFVYPLVAWGYTRERVDSICREWPHDLELPGDHYGNCTWCWKKSLRKLLTLAVDSPEVFDFPAKMDALYAAHRPHPERPDEPRRFFRQKLSTRDLVKIAKTTRFTKYLGETQTHLFGQIGWDAMDEEHACGQGCEIGGSR